MDLMSELRAMDPEIPCVYQGPVFASSVPVEIRVAETVYLPDDALVGRWKCCLITAGRAGELPSGE